MRNRPRLLDLCCCQGGASRGYADAGFEVVGVDIAPQPRYPYEFIQADALAVLYDDAFMDAFDAVHASWPCQRYSPLAALPSTKDYAEHPDLVGVGRDALDAWGRRTGRPWVIENVMSAPLDKVHSIVLCGCMFGLRTYRRRRFEPSPGLLLRAPGCRPHIARTATTRRRERWEQGWHVSITGDVGTYVGPEAMGIDWMTGNGLSEAIPPAYTRWVGAQLLALLDTDLALSATRPYPGGGDDR